MKKKLIAMIASFFVATACIIAGLQASADVSIMLFDETYVKGQIFEVPESAKIAGKSVAIEDVKIHAPDGKIYTDKSIALRQMGIYTVEFTAVDGTEKKTYTETFQCMSEIFSIDGKGSYEYKANEKTPYTYGVNVSLNTGDTFKYNKIINLNDLKPTDDLVNLYVVPEVIGKPDFYNLTITLTDIYDSTNKVMIRGNNVADGYSNGVFEWEYARYTCYFKAGSTNQPMAGLQGGEGGYLHVNNTYGYSSVCSFCGLGLGTTSMDTDRFTVSFDYQERKVLKDGNLVVDLDDPRYFTDLWEGFTTGEVYLSITLDDAGTFVVTDIANEKLTDEVLFFESDPPVLTIDYEGYEEIPNGIAGKKYPLFEATGKDSYSGELNVVKNIYYDFYGTKEKVEVEGDSFIPKKTGLYTAVYEVVDWCGNKATQSYDIFVNAVASPIRAVIDSEMQITTAKTGERVAIADIEVSGGQGELKVEKKVKDGNGASIQVDSGYFIPMTSGVYCVEYTITDYIGVTKVVDYTINVTTNESPVFLSDPTIPKYFMNGKKYVLPKLDGIIFSEGKVESKAAEIWVVENNGIRQKLEGNIYIPTITGSETPIQIIYRLSANGKTVEKTYDAIGYLTTDAENKMDMTSYFIHSGDVIATANKNTLGYETSRQGETLTFINPLHANNFSLCFNLAEMQNARVVTFTLTDYENAARKATAKFVYTGAESCSLIINGVDEYIVDKTYFGSSADIYLKFDNIVGRFGIADKSDNTAWYNLREEGYFVSGKVYLDIEFTEINGACNLLLSNLNGQNLKNLTVDILRPSVEIFSNVVGRKYSIGDIATTAKAVGLDVLDPYTETTLTVRDANRNIVYDVNGIKLENVAVDVEYQFEVKEYGNYMVVYSAKDSTNKVGSFQYVVSATDKEKPTIKLEYRVVETAKLGELIYIPKAYGTDNAPGDVKINYYTITPDGVLHDFNRELSDCLKATATGTYIIRYTATDAKGNMLLKDYCVIVE